MKLKPLAKPDQFVWNKVMDKNLAKMSEVAGEFIAKHHPEEAKKLGISKEAIDAVMAVENAGSYLIYDTGDSGPKWAPAEPAKPEKVSPDEYLAELTVQQTVELGVKALSKAGFFVAHYDLDYNATEFSKLNVEFAVVACKGHTPTEAMQAFIGAIK